MAPTVAQLLRDHCSLSIACTDRLYINGYMPRLQTGRQLGWFLERHCGNPIASPALLSQLRERFVGDIDQFVKRHDVPKVKFERGQRKDDIAQRFRAKFEAAEGVVFVGVAQERMLSFKGAKHQHGGLVYFDFPRESVYVNQYYFYVQDPDWGPAFVKVGSYLSYPVKLCLNGHEWAKQQLRREGIGFESLDNGFLSCEDPKRLQEVCDALRPEDIERFFERWSARLPWPLQARDIEAGYGHSLSIWQMEVSLTQVFDRPVQGRLFFEQVIRDNIDMGRPDRVSVLFPIRFNRRTPPPPHGYRTRVVTSGVQPSLHVEYKRSHVKQYFKEERALRTETTINNPEDFHVAKGIRSIYKLRDIGKRANQKLLEVEHLGSECVLAQDEMDRMQTPTVEHGQRVPAMRFGDVRVMALLQALCMFLHLPAGFSNKDLRPIVASLLGLDPDAYTRGMMTYDLRRLRLKGLIERKPKSHRYHATDVGLRVALFYSKLNCRLLRPGWAAIVPTDQIPRKLATAFARVEAEIERCRVRAMGLEAA